MGQPRNDGMFQPNDPALILSGIYPDIPEFERTVLYAPTFRDYGQVRLFPFDDFDLNRMEAFLEEHKMLLFIRTHIAEQGSAAPYLRTILLMAAIAATSEIWDRKLQIPRDKNRLISRPRRRKLVFFSRTAFICSR